MSRNSISKPLIPKNPSLLCSGIVDPNSRVMSFSACTRVMSKDEENLLSPNLKN